jgi:hypothetical protein
MPFAKHETFHIREGWLFKGMSAIETAEAEGQLPTIFLDRDAPERLGIGRNMVRALRFWMQATGLAEEQLEDHYATQRLTSFGEWVWQYDRYLEDETTLWLIHYHLACSRDQATTWYWFFNHFAPVTFEDNACLDALRSWVVSHQPEQKIALSSLKKDVHCLLRTYLPDEKARTPEDLTESPLARLGMLNSLDSGQHRYRLERLDPTRLDPLALLYVLVDQQQKKRPGTFQVGLTQVLREPMNAGRVFNLTTAVLSDLLAALNKQHPDWQVRFERAAGLDQLTLPGVEGDEVLTRYAVERIAMREGA